MGEKERMQNKKGLESRFNLEILNIVKRNQISAHVDVPAIDQQDPAERAFAADSGEEVLWRSESWRDGG